MGSAESEIAEVWRWRKRIPADDESLARWQSLIEEGFVPDGTVSQSAGQKTATVEVFTADASRADDLRLAYGGQAETIDAVALMQPMPTGGAPLRIRDRLLITESTDAEEIETLRSRFADRAVLSFPPELAFGTGRHGTTGTCLRLLADIAGERSGTSWRALDVGHGTGILAIAAVVMGAESGLGIDNDHFAVEVGRRNAQRHRLAPERCAFAAADLGKWQPPRAQRYQVIVANLFAGLLVEHLGRISGWLAESGDLVVSGILRSQAQEVCAAAAAAGLVFDAPCHSGKWVAMRGKRATA